MRETSHERCQPHSNQERNISTDRPRLVVLRQWKNSGRLGPEVIVAFGKRQTMIVQQQSVQFAAVPAVDRL